MFTGSKWLKPIGGLYGLVLRFRHFLFDSGIFKPQLGKLPTIVIGNLSLGGTGKTPHAEYILRQLSTWCKPALLSRVTVVNRAVSFGQTRSKPQLL
ncbi:MAG: tetraacyldisaccharide 4'-kinase [Flavobacteriales bacterium]